MKHKKWLCGVLSLLLLLSLVTFASCGEDGPSETTTGTVAGNTVSLPENGDVIP